MISRGALINLAMGEIDSYKGWRVIANCKHIA